MRTPRLPSGVAGKRLPLFVLALICVPSACVAFSRLSVPSPRRLFPAAARAVCHTPDNSLGHIGSCCAKIA